MLRIDFSLNIFSGDETQEAGAKQEKEENAEKGAASRKLTVLEEQLEKILGTWELTYGRSELDRNYAQRFEGVVARAYEQSGRQVVVLIDEYDKPVIDVEGNAALQAKNQQLLHGFYGALKGMGDYLRFVFITGITKFVHVNIFSGLNNLKDISLDARYATICGITERELREHLAEGVEVLAEENGCPLERAYEELKEMYDGYRFSPKAQEGVYNPYSLLLALDTCDVDSYWFTTGTPTYLFRALIGKWEDGRVPEVWKMDKTELQAATSESVTLTALLFQSGYLTIKSYDRATGEYQLRFPNQEVSTAFHKLLLYINKNAPTRLYDVNEMLRNLTRGHLEDFFSKLRTFLTGVSYQVEPSREAHFQLILLTLFRAMGVRVDSERAISSGRIDLVVELEKFVYIFGFKLDRPAAEAIQQIEEKPYAAPYAESDREVVKLGVCFSSKARNVSESIIRWAGREDVAIGF